MTTSRHDLMHGRQGGRIVDWNAGPGKTAKVALCDQCHLPMLGGQKVRHHICEPDSLVGKRCVCPPGCTDKVVGDQGKCAAACEPCRIVKGIEHRKVSAWQSQKS